MERVVIQRARMCGRESGRLHGAGSRTLSHGGEWRQDGLPQTARGDLNPPSEPGLDAQVGV